MAFLDNSGDIILDAVLTDTGRLRLAQGDGSFKISKFALGDDEINYALYNKTHASGSAYYDLEVLQTPVLEAFTNNTSTMKTKLISISRTNILYLPVLKLNRNDVNNDKVIQYGFSKYFSYDVTGVTGNPGTTVAENAKFYIAVDDDTYKAVTMKRSTTTATHIDNASKTRGLIQGYNITPGDDRDCIRIDQGLDTTELAPALSLDSDLLESAFIVELDYRLGRVKSPNTITVTPVNFIDDDNIASYYITDAAYINPNAGQSPADVVDNNGSYTKTDLDAYGNPMVFEGPRGNTLQLRIQASQELQSSTYLFTQLGSSQATSVATNILGLPASDDAFASGKTIYYIDSTIRIVGANTGYRLDIPVRYVKLA